MNDYIPILLRNESAKRRLVSVEFPVIEQYNRDREPEYRITIEPTAEGLALNYKLKPAHNGRLSVYSPRNPSDNSVGLPMSTSVTWPTTLLVETRQHSENQSVGSCFLHGYFCSNGCLALVGLL
jgi:hypothetical protein